MISDLQALDDIHQILDRPGDWSPEILGQIRDIVVATGRRLAEPVPIRVEMLEDLRGAPIAHLQTDGIVGYIRQLFDSGLCFDIHTQDDPAGLRLRFMVDGNLVYGPALDRATAAECRSAEQPAECPSSQPG